MDGDEAKEGVVDIRADFGGAGGCGGPFWGCYAAGYQGGEVGG